ncbi:MAG: T9SS type A sorting domain-containing protein, partial [Chitinophagales bacterium]
EGMYHGVIDSQDTLWLNTSNGKLLSFYDGVFTVKIPGGIYYTLAIDDYDNIFAPLSSTKILKFHTVIIDTLIITGTYSNYPFLIAADSNSFVYLIGINNQYLKFDANNWNALELGIPENVYGNQSALGTDEDHHIWFGTTNSILVKEENNLTSTIYSVNYSGLPDGGNYSTSAFYFNGNYNGGGILGTSEGLFEVSLSGHLISKIDSGFSSIMNDKKINCIEKFGSYYNIAVDTIWVGSNEGLFGMNKDYEWVQFTTSNSPLPNDTVNYIVFDDDKFWVATNGGVACYHFNGTWEIFTTTNSPLPGDIVHSISVESGSVIFCTSNGVAYFNDPDWKILNTSNSGLIDNNIQSLYTDYGYHYYFGTVAHGICDSVYNGSWIYLNTSSGLPSDSITFITDAPGGLNPIVAGTYGGGLLSIDDGNYLGNTTNIQGIDFNDATDYTLLDQADWAEMWITTDKGLLYQDFGLNTPSAPLQLNDITAYFSSENLIINYALKKSGAAQIELFDINGKQLSRVKIFGTVGENYLSLPASRLPSGMYILRMQSGNQFASVKAVKIQ